MIEVAPAPTAPTTEPRASGFVIKVREAKKMIGMVKSILNPSTVLPILADVYIEITKTGVRVHATDLESYIVTRPNVVSFFGEVSVCVCANYLKWFILKSFGDEISIDFGKSGRCRLTCGSLSIEVDTDRASEFPKEPVFAMDQSMSLDGNQFRSALSSAVGFVSSDDLRPAMTGVNISRIEDNVVVAAADAHRLYFKNAQSQSRGYAQKDLNKVLPKKFCQFVAAHIKGDAVDLELGDNHVKIDSGDVSIVSRLIDMRYPNWVAVLPKPILEITLDRQEVLRYLAIAQHFVSISTGELVVEVGERSAGFIIDNEMDGASSRHQVKAHLSQKAQPFSFAVKAEFLFDALKVNSKEPMVKLRHTTVPTQGFMIDEECLIMPLTRNR